jgi:hypothetical protein
MGDASPGGKQVGRVSIRVVPDATKFREDLKEQLKSQGFKDYEVEALLKMSQEQAAREAKGVAKTAAKAASGEKITYESEVNSRTLDQQARDAAARAAASAAREPLKVPTVPDSTSLDRFQRRMLSDLQKFMTKNELKIPLTADGERIRREIFDWEEEIRKQIKLKIPVELDVAAEQRKKIQNLMEEVKKLDNSTRVDLQPQVIQARIDAGAGGKDGIPVNVDLNTVLAEIELQKFRAEAANRAISVALRPELEGRQAVPKIALLRLWALNNFRIKIPVDVEVDNDRVGKALAGISAGFAGVAAVGSKALSGVVGGLSDITSGAFSAVKGFASLSQGMMLFVAAIGLISPALALVSGALVTIPALLAGLLVPIGAVMFGLDGIKKAAENAGLFSDTNGKKKGGGEIGAALQEIKKQVSDTFERGLTPAFVKIGELANYVKDSFAGVANGLSELFNGFTDALTSPAGKDQISNTIENIGVALARARPGLRDFTTGILELVSELSFKFPGLADAFNRTGKSFMEWVDKITTKDPVTQVSQLDSAMKTLGDTLSGLGAIVSDLFSDGFGNLSSETFAASMESFVASINELVNDVLPGLASAFETIAAALEPIVAAIEAAQDAWDFVFPDSSAGGIPDWVPLIGSWDNILQDWFGDGGDGISEREGFRLAAALNKGLTAGVVGGAQLGVDGNIVPIEKITSAIEGELAQADLAAQADALKSVFGGTGVTDEVRNNINRQMQEITTSVLGSLNTLGPQIDTAVTNATTSLTKLPETIKTGFQNSITGIQTTITGMFILIAQSISTQSANLSNEFTKSFQGLPGKIGAALASAPAAITGALAPVRGAVATSMAEAAAAANEGGALTAQVAAASFGTVAPAISGAMQPCITAVSTVCGQMVDTALSYIGAMRDAGGSVGAAFAEGLANSTSLVATAAAAVMGAARAQIPSSPAKEGPFSGRGWVTYSGKSVGEGFADGLSDSSNGVVQTTRELMQAVKDVFGDASGLTLNFNLGAAAMGSMAEDAQKFNSSMSSAATSLGTVKSKSGSSSINDAARIDSQSQAELDNLKWEQERLTVMQDMLNLQTRGASEAQKNEIKRQTDLLGLQKERLAMQGKELEYWSKYEDKSRDYNDAWSDLGEKAKTSLTDIGKTVGQQAMSDLGIGGQGAISNLITEGSKYVFNVMDMQSAMTAQKTFEQRDALTYTQR